MHGDVTCGHQMLDILLWNIVFLGQLPKLLLLCFAQGLSFSYIAWNRKEEKVYLMILGGSEQMRLQWVVCYRPMETSYLRTLPHPHQPHSGQPKISKVNRTHLMELECRQL